MKVTIDGIEYVRAHTPEVKEEKPDRIMGFVHRRSYLENRVTAMTTNKVCSNDTRMIEIKENEIILSEAELADAYNKTSVGRVSAYESSWFRDLRNNLGFKKDGV